MFKVQKPQMYIPIQKHVSDFWDRRREGRKTNCINLKRDFSYNLSGRNGLYYKNVKEPLWSLNSEVVSKHCKD